MKKTYPCSLCKSRKLTKINNFSSRPIVKCQNCGLVQVNPLPPEKKLKHYYDRDYFRNYASYVANSSSHEKYFRRKLVQVEKKAGKKGRLLDIGCALGDFLEMAEKMDWQTQGLEISKEAVIFCKKKGLEVVQGTIETADFTPNSFDLITCFETIEHVKEPEKTIKGIFRLLKKGGLVMLTTPNYDTWTRKLMKGFWFGYRHQEHIFFFTPKTLKRLFEKAGFSEIKIKRDEVRPFSLSYFFSRLAFYLRFWPLKSTLNFISKMVKSFNLNLSLDPWGDLIVLAKKK